LEEHFSDKQARFSPCESSRELIGVLGKGPIGVLLIDHGGYHDDILPILKTISRRYYETIVYLFNVSVHEPLEATVKRSVTGAFEGGTKPSQMIQEIEKQTDLLAIMREEGIFGHSSVQIRAAEAIYQVAQSDVTVLIGGESGTGKEMYARAIHSLSPRNEETFVPVNCGAIAEGVLESELFGHEKGAFTGAAGRREGYFEVADGGTIFLDEIGEIKPDIQVRLLRVLDQRSFMRVGGANQISVDVRIIAASNKDLRALTLEGEFREDLYYRLSVVTLIAAPLRDRPVDIMPLVRRFLSEKNRGDVRIEPDAVDLLLQYSWPGNIRELRNFVESSLVTSAEGIISTATVSDYINSQTRSNRQLPVVTGKTRHEADFQLVYQALLNLAHEVAGLKDLILNRTDGLRSDDGSLHVPLYPEMEVRADTGIKSVEQMERELIAKALREVDGNRRKAAEILGIGERTLYRKIKQYSLQ
jgi:DNA-binding NtrC family response regulator